jgi:glucokinase
MGPLLSKLDFAQAFGARDNGADVLPHIPVFYAPDGELGLMGCATYLAQLRP